MAGRADYVEAEYLKARKLSLGTLGVFAALAAVGLVASFAPMPGWLLSSEDLLLVPAWGAMVLGVWNWLLAAHLLLIDRRIHPHERRRWWAALVFLNVFGGLWFILARAGSNNKA